ncbi:MAG: hypothetical protein JOZ99_04085 [Actinobacteria bacterium]|nr:hypothetical protein [Actinomycetota bacterium]
MQSSPTPVITAAAAGAALVLSAVAYLVKRSDYDEVREEGLTLPTVTPRPAGS